MLGKLKQIFNIKPKNCGINTPEKIEHLFDSLKEDQIRLEFGSDIVPYGEKVCSIIDGIRNEIKDELGFIMPAVHVLDNQNLQENEYTIKIQDKVLYRGFVIPNEEGI